MSPLLITWFLLGACLGWSANAGTGSHQFSAQSGPRQRCEPALRSALWPGDANAHPRVANEYAREGRLWICTNTRQGLRWEQMSVHFKQLGAKLGSPKADSRKTREPR